MENKKIDRSKVLLVDENDIIIGKMSKTEAHQSPVLHRAFSIFLYHDDKMLIQQRAFHKYHSGGLWANTCCSHPVDNMCITLDAKERLFEETGIKCELTEIFKFQYMCKFQQDLYEHELDHVFVGEYCGTPVPNPEEVEMMRWITFEELEKELMDNPEKYCYWFKIAAPKVIEYIKTGKIQK